MSAASRLLDHLLHLQPLLLVCALCGLLAAGLGAPTRAWADGDPSTGERVLGTFLGSVDGALIARALTLREERTPTVAFLYAGAVCGGATLGYLLADDEDALTVMGIVMIPLAILNLVLPSTSPYFNFDSRGFPADLAVSGDGSSANPALAAASEPWGDAAAGWSGDWWRTTLLGMVPQPAPRGARVTPIHVRF